MVCTATCRSDGDVWSDGRRLVDAAAVLTSGHTRRHGCGPPLRCRDKNGQLIITKRHLWPSSVVGRLRLMLPVAQRAPTDEHKSFRVHSVLLKGLQTARYRSLRGRPLQETRRHTTATGQDPLHHTRRTLLGAQTTSRRRHHDSDNGLNNECLCDRI